MTGHFATAKAGHDAGGLYVIVREEDGYVYLCDGRLRSIEAPKKKNRRHIQIINKTVNEDIRNRLLRKEKVFDHEIKYEIKQYLTTT
ncbi:MAG: KOW domain-containing RNA-binding protein [Lachnospiraceae bacterium]|nr:KOW domain-containing RNA-binding protein [Lachnospiraceae bacterium]